MLYYTVVPWSSLNTMLVSEMCSSQFVSNTGMYQSQNELVLICSNAVEAAGKVAVFGHLH